MICYGIFMREVESNLISLKYRDVDKEKIGRSKREVL